MSKFRTVMKGCPPTIFVTAEESDRVVFDLDLQAEIVAQIREQNLGNGVQICTDSGYMPIAWVDRRFV